MSDCMQFQLHLHVLQLHVRRDTPFDYMVSPLRCIFFLRLLVFSSSFFLPFIVFIFPYNSMSASMLQLIATLDFLSLRRFSYPSRRDLHPSAYPLVLFLVLFLNLVHIRPFLMSRRRDLHQYTSRYTVDVQLDVHPIDRP